MTSSGFLHNGPCDQDWGRTEPFKIQINLGHDPTWITEGLPVAVLMGGTLAADVARGILVQLWSFRRDQDDLGRKITELNILKNYQRVVSEEMYYIVLLYYCCWWSDCSVFNVSRVLWLSHVIHHIRPNLAIQALCGSYVGLWRSQGIGKFNRSNWALGEECGSCHWRSKRCLPIVHPSSRVRQHILPIFTRTRENNEIVRHSMGIPGS